MSTYLVNFGVWVEYITLSDPPNKQIYAQKNRVFICLRSKRVVCNAPIAKSHMEFLRHVDLPCVCLGEVYHTSGTMGLPKQAEIPLK